MRSRASDSHDHLESGAENPTGRLCAEASIVQSPYSPHRHPHPAGIPSLWIRQTQNYHWMWATALLPAPAVWFLLLQATLFESGSDIVMAQFSFFAIALLWA